MMDETNYYKIEKRQILHPGGWQESISMEKWYWEALDWIVNEKGTPLNKILETCDKSRAEYELDYALRYYVQEYVDRYDRYSRAEANK